MITQALIAELIRRDVTNLSPEDAFDMRQVSHLKRRTLLRVTDWNSAVCQSAAGQSVIS